MTVATTPPYTGANRRDPAHTACRVAHDALKRKFEELTAQVAAAPSLTLHKDRISTLEFTRETLKDQITAEKSLRETAELKKKALEDSEAQLTGKVADLEAKVRGLETKVSDLEADLAKSQAALVAARGRPKPARAPVKASKEDEKALRAWINDNAAKP